MKFIVMGTWFEVGLKSVFGTDSMFNDCFVGSRQKLVGHFWSNVDKIDGRAFCLSIFVNID